MNAADLAIVAIAVVSLAHGHWHHRFRMGMVDRIRVVSPPKAQAKEAAAKDELPSITAARRTG